MTTDNPIQTKIIRNVDAIINVASALPQVAKVQKDWTARFEYWLGKAFESEQQGNYAIDDLAEHLLRYPYKLDDLVSANPAFAKAMIGKVLALYAENIGRGEIKNPAGGNQWRFEIDKISALRKFSDIAVKHLDAFASVSGDDLVFDALVRTIDKKDKAILLNTANAYLKAVAARSEEMPGNTLRRLRTLFCAVNDKRFGGTPEETRKLRAVERKILETVDGQFARDPKRIHAGIHELVKTADEDAYQIVSSIANEYDREGTYSDFTKVTSIFLARAVFVATGSKFPLSTSQKIASMGFPLESRPEHEFLQIFAHAYINAQESGTYIFSSRFTGTLKEFQEFTANVPPSEVRHWHGKVATLAQNFIRVTNSLRSANPEQGRAKNERDASYSITKDIFPSDDMHLILGR